METITSLEQLTTVDAIRQCLEGTQNVDFGVKTTKQDCYRRVQKARVKHQYIRLNTADKGCVTLYLIKVTDYSHAQVKRLIQKCVKSGTITVKRAPGNGFQRACNFHRPCYFPAILTDNKGRQRKQYRYKDRMTPCEKLRSLRRPGQHLKPGISFKKLDAFANEMTDNEAAEQLNSAPDRLFKQLHERLKLRA